MNDVDDEIESTLSKVIDRTSDEFSVTISSNKIAEEIIQKLHSKIKNLHKAQIDIAMQQAELEGKSTDDIHLDKFIHLKRL